jgi:hypothetical protein
MMPAFTGDGASVVPRTSVCSRPMGNGRHAWRDGVDGVEAATQPDLQYGQVALDGREMQQGYRGAQFVEGRLGDGRTARRQARRHGMETLDRRH